MEAGVFKREEVIRCCPGGWGGEMSTVCDRFGKRAGQQGGENELNKVDGEEEKGGKVAEKWGERRGREAGRATT